MKIAVISGISGQDGALLAAKLVGLNYHVIGLFDPTRQTDFFRLNYLGVASKVTLQPIELTDASALRKFIADVQPHEFYNLAAVSSVGYSFNDPLGTYTFNTASVLNILEAIRLTSPSTKFYQASSSEMFGNIAKSRLPLKESYLFNPASPYGISKASAHWLTVNYREAYKLRTCCGILFNHESALRPENFVVKKIIKAAINIKSGSPDKLLLGNTSIIRDWGYAPAYVDAMHRMMQAEKLDDYLICSGVPISLSELVALVFSQLDLDSKEFVAIDETLNRRLDLEMIYGDNSKARTELEWEYALEPSQLVQRLIDDEYALMHWQKTVK